MDELFVELVDSVFFFFGVDEYRFDLVEFVLDKYDGFFYLYYVFYMLGLVMVVVIICRDLYFRDSEVGFILGDIEVVFVVDCNLLFLYVLEGENFNEENGIEFFLDEEDKVDCNDL